MVDPCNRLECHVSFWGKELWSSYVVKLLVKRTNGLTDTFPQTPFKISRFTYPWKPNTYFVGTIMTHFSIAIALIRFVNSPWLTQVLGENVRYLWCKRLHILNLFVQYSHVYSIIILCIVLSTLCKRFYIMCHKFVKVYFGVQVYSGLQCGREGSVSKVWLHKRAAAADRMELNPSARHAHSALHYTHYSTLYSIQVNTTLRSVPNHKCYRSHNDVTTVV